MKKFLLIAALALFSFNATSVQAQEMKAGVNLALPTGDFKDFYSFGIQADYSYLFEVADSFSVGPTAGLMYYMGKTMTMMGISIDVDDALFLPIGGTARYSFDEFFVGADLGYGIGLAPSGMDGGFYYRPKAGYSFGSITAVLSYSGVSVTGGTFSSFNAGIEISL